MKNYISLISLTICLSSLLMGCTGFSTKINKIQKAQEIRFALVDKKIENHEQILSNLQSSSNDVEVTKRHIEELLQNIVTMSVNYSKLQTALDSLDDKIETRNSSLENVLSEAKKHINDLEARVGIIQEIENDLQTKITKLQSQLSDITTEIKQYNANYNELGYSDQWLRETFGKIGQQEKSENKKEDR